MKTIKSLKDITTLEVGDKVVFDDLKYVVTQHPCCKMYYLLARANYNDKIFRVLNINKRDFIENLGINANCSCDFPETKSLEALTAIVSALFKEYEKQNKLPKTWEEFCERNPIKTDEAYITHISDIVIHDSGCKRRYGSDRNVCTSVEEAKAFRALMQLRQLRKAYVKDWEPDLGKKEYYGIVYTYDGIKIESYQLNYRCLSFPTCGLAEQFLNNFKDLLEIAKPLL